MKSTTLSLATLTLLVLSSLGACKSGDDVRPDDARAGVGASGNAGSAGGAGAVGAGASPVGGGGAGAAQAGAGSGGDAGQAGQAQGGSAGDAGGGGTAGQGGGGASGGGGGSGAQAGGGQSQGTAGQAGSSGAAGASPAPGSKESCARPRPGPSMVSITTPSGKSFCIDRHEVTMAQYDEFVTAIGAGPIPKIEGCELNTELVDHPTGSGTGPWCDKFKPKETPNAPMSCLGWCDAAAYCAWAGKRLCGAIGGGQTPEKAVSDPLADEWLYVCTNGGKTKYPYGDTEDDAKCSTDDKAAVDAYPTCTGVEAPFSGVVGLTDSQVGGQGEWVDVQPLTWPGSVLPSRYFRALPQKAADCYKFATLDPISAAPTSFRCCGE